MATVAVEAWYDHELYVWNWFGGRCEINNEKTLMAFSPLVMDILSGIFNIFLPISYSFVPGGKTRCMVGYFRGDGVYLV